MSVENTLVERGDRYGDFTGHAQIAQDLMWVMVNSKSVGMTAVPCVEHPAQAAQISIHSAAMASGWQRLTPVQCQALTVIADKIARILNGDPNYADNWHDIQGYAKLAEDRISKPEPPPSRGPSIDSDAFDRSF